MVERLPGQVNSRGGGQVSRVLVLEFAWVRKASKADDGIKYFGLVHVEDMAHNTVSILITVEISCHPLTTEMEALIHLTGQDGAR